MKATSAYTCPNWPFGLAKPLPMRWAPGFLRTLDICYGASDLEHRDESVELWEHKT